MRCGTGTFRLCGGRSFLFACLAFLLVAGSVWARPTPYDKKPAAVVTEDYGGKGLLWDFQLAKYLSGLPNRRGITAAVLGFCHSGGFVDDLSPLSDFYVATACEWDQFSLQLRYDTCTQTFRRAFMNASKSKTLHQAFGEARASVSGYQTPQECQDGLGSMLLHYVTGDRAVLFSAMDREEPNVDQVFWEDMTIARDALMTRSAGAWPKESIAAYYGDGNRYFQDGTKVNGKALKDKTPDPNDPQKCEPGLFGAIESVYADPNFTDNSLLFLYLNNHGVSSDVLKSRCKPLGGGVYKYEYQIATSLYANLERTRYGITEVWIEVPDKEKSHYKNPKPPKDYWDFKIEQDAGKIWMKWYSTKPDEPSTWLEPGDGDEDKHKFYYEYPVKSKQVPWKDFYRSYRKVGQQWELIKDEEGKEIHLYDWGDTSRHPDARFGVGAVVYRAEYLGAPDPEQWPDWDNGGDGWVLAPAWAIPEPAALLLFGYGLIPVLPVLWRRVQK